jgi:uncharacterized protein YjbJ (UPF0337 family)
MTLFAEEARVWAPGRWVLERNNLLRGTIMSMDDKAQHKSEELKGTVKEGVGKLTSNHSLEAEGKAEKWAGKAKGAVDEAVNDLTDDDPRR